jgi:CDP-glycerol glycerophosphotransferase
MRIKIFYIKLIATLLKFFWVIPLKKKTVLFLSFNGKQFSDSPKAVYDEMQRRSKNYKLIWGFRNPEGIKNISRVEYVKIPSLHYFLTFCTSKYIIVNDFINTYLPVRKSQVLINTWHGGGWFKKVGLTGNNASEYNHFFFDYQCKKHTYFVASSEYFVDTVLHPSFNYQGEILRTGMPRNAIFFQENQNIKIEVRSKFTDDKDAFLVLFAPTYRNYSIPEEAELDLNRLKHAVSRKFGKHVVILFRAHHLINKFPIDYSSVIDVTSYPDMQQLLLACDMLVSDYSSCMWDAAVQDKIVLVYAPDAQQYIDNRGFFLDIREWPFLLAFNNDEMVKEIDTYDKERYIMRLHKLVEESKSYEGKDAVKEICTIIMNQNN